MTDADKLRVVAHPLRMRILGSLRIDGPATSALLARRLRTDSGQTSHHLRQLAKHGFVEEAPERGRGARGRERWWKAVHDAMEFTGPGELGPGGADALQAVQRNARAIWDEAIDRFHEEVARQRWNDDWQRVAYSSDRVLRTTPAGLERLQAGIERLIREADLGEAAAPEAETVLVVLHTYPHRARR